MMKLPYTKLISTLCLLLTVLLAVSACAPRIQSNPSAEASQPVSIAEPEQPPVGEPEPLEPESLEPDSDWSSPSEEEPLPGDSPEAAGSPTQPPSTHEGASAYSPAAQSVVPLSLNGGSVTPQFNLCRQPPGKGHHHHLGFLLYHGNLQPLHPPLL